MFTVDSFKWIERILFILTLAIVLLLCYALVDYASPGTRLAN